MLEEFANILRYPDFETFFSRFSTFVNSNYSGILSYYSGNGGYLQKNVIEDLNDLIKEYDKVVELVNTNTNRLSVDTGYWDVLEAIDEVGIKLQSIKNTPKWQRSSIDIDYTSKQVIDTFLKSGQTIEAMIEELGSTNSDTEWANVAIQNNKFEEDYTHEGEKSLSIRVSLIGTTSPLNAVDIMTGDNVLGKDIYREIIFEDEDIKVLAPQDTVTQSAEIILSVARGSIQEYPNMGYDKSQVSTNLSALQYPSIFRQLVEMFKQDDSFQEVSLIDTSIDQDAFFMSLLITSRIGTSAEQTFKVFDDTYDTTFN